MVKEIRVFYTTHLANHYSISLDRGKTNKPFADWLSARKELIEGNRGRKIKIYTNIEEIIEDLKDELDIVDQKIIK